MIMTPERWETLKELFEGALNVTPTRRSALVQERCSDLELCAEVERLLSEYEEARSFLSTPLLGDVRLDGELPLPYQSLSEGALIAGRYRISKFIAVGGMGEVYAAEDTQLDRVVALKFLPRVLTEDRQSLEQFRREARAASALNHPNICTIYDFAEDSSRPFIAMEYLDGETLAARLKRGPCSLSEGLSIAIDVSSALSAAHAQGVIHRDLKPGNIMLTDTGAKLLDFGIARSSRSIPADRMAADAMSGDDMRVIGTLPYVSPEQLRGDETDTRGDIFSFGAVLYEIFSGKGAFKGYSRLDTIAAVAWQEPEPIRQLAESVPEDLQSVIQRCLKKEPLERCASMSEVERELRNCEARAQRSASRVTLKQLATYARRPVIGFPLIVLVSTVVVLLVWRTYSSSRVRWARNQATPQIASLLEDEKVEQAYALAVQAERYIPDDTTLKSYISDMSWSASINTDPPGASIYRKNYNAPDNVWELIGLSPIAKARRPLIDSQWKFELKGFDTIELATFAIHPPNSITVALDKSGTAPAGMVHVDLRGFRDGSGKVELYGIPGYDAVPAVHLKSYWIDKFEVTNGEFKRFVEQGGYERPEFWKQVFVMNGHSISRAEAMRLFRDKTGQTGPSTWSHGNYPSGRKDFPVTGVSWFEAAAYAEFVGKALPTFYHWIGAAYPPAGPTVLPLSNFSQVDLAPVGKYQGMSWSGAFDLAGNAKEWVLNEAGTNRRYILGGGWNEPAYMLFTADARSPFDRKATFGFRCAKYELRDEEAKAAAPIAVQVRNYDLEKPVSDQLFRAYKGIYSYDKTPLHPIVERISETDAWREERITFDAAYGGEKVILHLFLPKNASPPFQTVLHFTGAEAFYERSSANLGQRYQYLEDFDFFIRSGRAVAFPVFKGMFERWDDLLSWSKDSSFYRDNVIDWAKDLGRTIDYLETRTDLDKNKFAYEGTSMGAGMGALLPAVETRFKAVVLISPGFWLQKRLPESDPFNFAPRVKAPVLMVNGRYDFLFPVGLSQDPLFRLLGPPTEQKRRVMYNVGHDIPRAEESRESLDWLDRYLGPVRLH